MLDKIGVKAIINASGTLTVLGGNRLVPEALEAIKEVSNVFVNMEELSTIAGKFISELIGAGDAFITAGAASGLILTVSAAITKGDPEMMANLPITEGLRNRVIIQHSHTMGNPYYHLIELSGAKLQVVGRETGITVDEIRNAIGEQTAAIVHFLFEPQDNEVPLSDIINIAHSNGIPVIVDAAAELPPSENLKNIIKSGADVVVFSGGKDIGAPSNTGIIIGRDKEIIQNCRKLGPLSYLNVKGEKRTFIGRPMKVSKEDIVAFVAAFERYLTTDHYARIGLMDKIADKIMKEIKKEFPALFIEKFTTKPNQRVRPVTVPKLRISLPLGIAEKCTEMLKKCDPPIYVYTSDRDIYINTQCLLEQEVEPLVRTIVSVLKELKI